jgi:uncharacterized protein YcfL
MKRLTLLPIFLLLFIGCETKKSGVVAGQEVINKQLTGLYDSLEHVSDSESINRIKGEIKVLQHQFDSLNTEYEKMEKK